MRKDCIIRGRVQEQSLYRLKRELFIALIRNISNRVFLRFMHAPASECPDYTLNRVIECGLALGTVSMIVQRYAEGRCTSSLRLRHMSATAL